MTCQTHLKCIRLQSLFVSTLSVIIMSKAKLFDANIDIIMKVNSGVRINPYLRVKELN
jgi:hypothetical protein